MSSTSDGPGTATDLPAAPRRATPLAAVVPPVAIGSLVAVALGVYGRLHDPASVAVNIAGFSGPLPVKAWLTTLAFGLALFQLGSALVMWGKVPRITAPAWIGAAHRWSGRLAVLATVPVAVHCLYALGLQFGEPRVLAALPARLLLLRRLRGQDAAARPPRRTRVGAAGDRRPHLHRVDRALADLGAVVLHHVRRGVLTR